VLGAVRRLEATGRRVQILPVDALGRADPGDIPRDASLVSIGVANNEVGTVQPAAEIIARAKALGALVHLDACCGPRWIEIPRGADLISMSGYKLGAGRGGLLYVRDGVRIDPLQLGGPQEWGRRSGQEDVMAARAMAVAVDESARTRTERSAAARPLADELRASLAALGAKITGPDDRLPNFASCAFADRRGEDLVLSLDLDGVAVSSGSACASGSLDPSHVLLAMGLTLEEALGSLRLTVGYDTTRDDIEHTLEILSRTLARRTARA
jgi:cysteine desulfurase